MISLAPILCLGLALLLPIGMTMADDSTSYVPPVVEARAFDFDKVRLLDVERKKFATNLAGYVVNDMNARHTNAKSKRKLDNARKLIGLALQLDPRNRVALVANYQLKRGVVPKTVEVDYQAASLSRLLLAKAELMTKTGDSQNLSLAGFLPCSSSSPKPYQRPVELESA